MPLSVVLHHDWSSPRSSAFGRVTLWVVLDRLHVISCIVTISRVERFDVVFQLCPTRHRGLQLGLPNARQTGRHLKSDLVETQHYAECPCPIDDRARQWDRVDVKICEDNHLVVEELLGSSHRSWPRTLQRWSSWWSPWPCVLPLPCPHLQRPPHRWAC